MYLVVGITEIGEVCLYVVSQFLEIASAFCSVLFLQRVLRYVRNPIIVGSPHFPQNYPWYEFNPYVGGPTL
jgi:hypothetical protein